MELKPFEFVESDLTRKYTNLQPICQKTLMKYMHLTTLEVEKAITKSSPILDGKENELSLTEILQCERLKKHEDDEENQTTAIVESGWPCIQPSRGAEREPVMDPNGNTRQFAKEDTRVVNNPMTIQQICQRGERSLAKHQAPKLQMAIPRLVGVYIIALSLCHDIDPNPGPREKCGICQKTYVGYVSGAPRRPRSPRDAPKPNADKGGEKEDVAESETTKRNASRESNNDQTQIKPEYGHGTFREPPCSSPKNMHMQYLLWERKT